ncbi:hypothetical protein RKD49_000056 [Streptomyces glaucescens]
MRCDGTSVAVRRGPSPQAPARQRRSSGPGRRRRGGASLHRCGRQDVQRLSAAGATMPHSVSIMPIAAPSASGSRPPRRTTVPVRRFVNERKGREGITVERRADESCGPWPWPLRVESCRRPPLRAVDRRPPSAPVGQSATHRPVQRVAVDAAQQPPHCRLRRQAPLRRQQIRPHTKALQDRRWGVGDPLAHRQQGGRSGQDRARGSARARRPERAVRRADREGREPRPVAPAGPGCPRTRPRDAR